MLHSSETEERKMNKNSTYDSPHSGNGGMTNTSQDLHNQRQMKSDYQKYVERNYKSGGSGSTSGGGQSRESMIYMKKNNFYPHKVKHNISDMTDQENIHSIHDDKSSMFYTTKVPLEIINNRAILQVLM